MPEKLLKRSFTRVREMIRMTKAVYTDDLKCEIDLRKLTMTSVHVVYVPSKFAGAVGKHLMISGCCLVFFSRSIVGKTACLEDGIIRAQRYVRPIKRKRFSVGLLQLKLVSVSTFQKNGTILDGYLVGGNGSLLRTGTLSSRLVQKRRL